jgi:hypothetical protein
MFFPDGGSVLLSWMRCSMRRFVRRARSNARLYQALAERETNDGCRELYRLQADHQRSRAARKLTSLFNLRARLPVDRDPLAARVWRRLLIMCGPRMAAVWIEWREGRELMLLIVVSRAIVRLTRLQSGAGKRSTS